MSEEGKKLGLIDSLVAKSILAMGFRHGKYAQTMGPFPSQDRQDWFPF